MRQAENATLKFWERELLDFVKPYYVHERTQRFGMYYFLTRIVQPLLMAPDAPRYDHKLNDVAKRIAAYYPDFEDMGHLVAFVFQTSMRHKTCDLFKL